jgi:hypothetical protein
LGLIGLEHEAATELSDLNHQAINSADWPIFVEELAKLFLPSVCTS